MINQIILVGRLVRDPKTKELENGVKVSYITLAIPRNYKNIDGEYDTDFISCTLHNGLAENTAKYCKKGDLIGVKGKIEKLNGNDLQIVAEKVAFLSSRKENEEE